MKKIAAIMIALSMAAISLSGCSQTGAGSSASATPENPMVLTLAHGLSETHTVHIAMTEFAEQVEEKTGGRVQVRILPNGQLGSENENMEQLMAGVISMTKVSAPGLATYNESYHAFGLPYVFDDTENFYHVMDSSQMQDFFLSSEADGFVTLTYYTSGARSFYTKNKAIRKPEDLKGLKIRVQDMKSQTDMMQALGGIPVAMSYGDVYTSLQTGIIDGTENNETALTTGKHGEICKVYSTDQHAMIPDVMVMSAKVWANI
ncbi:MAG: TRAP transporter substrate-binding protein, partial [Lachnospiraceae bacterium]|nr:TRAP transporter substrate-binding protein [Lachnospiraceae bacterium]